MHIYFGIVKKYLPEKGFGFLTHPISLGHNKDIFFHITNVKRSHEDIAEKLSIYNGINNICFWYVAETTRKGEQLQSILEPQDVFDLQQDNPIDFKDKIELIWRNIDKSIPFWLSELTIGLFGSSGHDKLKSERETLIQKGNEEREIRRKEQESIRKIEEEKAKIEWEKKVEERKKQEEERAKARMKAKEDRNKQRERDERQEKIEEEEFELLVTEMESKKFTMSAEVSNYIIRNRLGDKYQTISGVLEMANTTSSWKFNGGFPPKIYARLCARLNLDNKGTDSRVTGFTSFKDLKNSRNE